MSEELLTEAAAPARRAAAAKKAAKKATAKKAAKKAATKKVTTAKAAPEPALAPAPAPSPVPEPLKAQTAAAPAKKAAKNATAKKAALKAQAAIQDILPFDTESAPLFPPAPPRESVSETPKAPPPPPVAAAPISEAPPAPMQEPQQQPPAADQPPAPQPSPAPVSESQGEPQPADQPNHNHREGGHPNGHPQQQERRKSKFERWKERRERFRQERQARQQGGQNGQGNPQGGQNNHQDRRANQDRDRGQGGHNRDPHSQPHHGDDSDRVREHEKPLGPPEPVDGILEMTPKGYGFLRQRDRHFAQHPNDAFIGPEFIRKYGLREGMHVKGVQQKGSRGQQVTELGEVNGRVPEAMRDLPLFEELKAINPNKRIQLETVKDRLTTRVIDMITPVGRGQRGLIVAPPRAGKTTLLQHIAEAVVENHPGMHLMILLVDERPEEVTEFKRSFPKAEIYASSNDQDVKSHTRIAAFAIERAKRLVECGEHVFILMDSITRLARAFNNAKQGGATMSGGMGVGAMEIPRRLFAAARNTRTAGSLTILATALVETGSRMDDLIFQEFKGTGNMELVLDRKIAEQYYYPAVNIFKSGTRREELLLQAFQLDKIHMLRRGLAGHKPIEAIQRVLSLLERYPSNAQMLVDLPSKSS